MQVVAKNGEIIANVETLSWFNTNMISTSVTDSITQFEIIKHTPPVPKVLTWHSSWRPFVDTFPVYKTINLNGDTFDFGRTP